MSPSPRLLLALALVSAPAVALAQPAPAAWPAPPPATHSSTPTAAPSTVAPIATSPAPTTAARPAALPLPPPPPADAPVAAAARPRRPSLLRERLHILDRTLLPLPDRSRDARLSSGLVSVAMGAGLVGLGFVPIWGDGDTPSLAQTIVWFQGGYSLASGAVTLLWAPAREGLARQYGEMPDSNARERRARVRFGEQALDDMAADGRRRRILSALGSVAYSLGTLAIFYRDQIFNGAPMPEPAGMSYLVIGTVSIQSLVSLIGVFSPSEEERLRDAYHREVEMMRRLDAQPADEPAN